MPPTDLFDNGEISTRNGPGTIYHFFLILGVPGHLGCHTRLWCYQPICSPLYICRRSREGVFVICHLNLYALYCLYFKMSCLIACLISLCTYFIQRYNLVLKKFLMSLCDFVIVRCCWICAQCIGNVCSTLSICAIQILWEANLFFKTDTPSSIRLQISISIYSLRFLIIFPLPVIVQEE